MGSSVLDLTEKGNPPLTRIDVEQLLLKVGSSRKLDLREQNLRGIDLSSMHLVGSFFSGADLTEANLSGANLNEAILNGTNLSLANLNGADLSGAILSRAILNGTDLSKANLSRANLYHARLSGTDLDGTILTGAFLDDVDLTKTVGQPYVGSETEKTYFQNIFRARSRHQERLRSGIFSVYASDESALLLRVRIHEEPLTAQNLTTIISGLTELSTKYWLIAKSRFADLIEYTQTHNGRFADEARIVITHISYNSPFNMEWKVDLSAPSVAEALVTTIDGITQRQERLEKAKLENQAMALEIKEAEQKAEQDNHMALLEQEKHRLELEQRRLEVLEKQLEVQKKSIEYALEIAGKVVDTLHPGADPATRAMEIQALLPNLVQLQNGKGLELALPILPKSTE